MQSGVWVNTLQRSGQLVKSNRFTLSDAFKRAGWRTVDDVPSNNRPWAPGSSFYHFDKVYNRLDVGYRGPSFAYASMPDQYVLSALQRLELAKSHRRPVFSEVDLVSSHTPWTRIPRLISWRRLGNGSIFGRLPVDRAGLTDTQQAYAHSIEYTLRALYSFIDRYGNKNTVLIVVGDEQPSRVIERANHDVPATIIAHDPKVIRRLSGWGWTDGMLPSPTAPVWLMSRFRNRFFNAFDH